MDEIFKDIYFQLKTATLLQYFGILAITLLATFVYYWIRFQYELERYQLENKEKEFTIWKHFNERDEIERKEFQEFSRTLKSLSEKKSDKQTESIHDRLKEMYYHGIFPRNRDLMECAKIKNKFLRKENVIFLKEYIIPFLEFSKDYFELYPKKLGLSRSTLEPYYQFGKENIRFFDWKLKKKYIPCKQDIENEQ